ncbi:MAG TPA: hypothetical protein VJL88_16210 [Nitrospira sp.]|nr:hypothetical protein [Nitrospira sp.]
MRQPNGATERTFDPGVLNEKGFVDRSSTNETSKPASDHVLLNVEMAIEWAHLGGD